MKWLAFTAACVVALIALGVLAVDERDVEWEGRKPLCPYCRVEVSFYAVACSACDRTLDWEPHKEPCRWCLQKEDVELLRDGLHALELEDDDPLPASLAEFAKPYLLAIEPGKCTYCGGLGSVLRGEEELPCPVCRGEENCVACGGDRVVVVGDKRAHRRRLERGRVWEEALRRERLTHLPLRRAALVDDDVEALNGQVEAEELVDEDGNNLLELARRRIERAYGALHDAVRQKGLKIPAGTPPIPGDD